MKIDDFLDSPQPNTNKRAGAVRIDDFLGETKTPSPNTPTSGLGAAVVSRALGLVGDLVEGTARIGEQGGDWLERRVPLSGLSEEQLQQRQLDPLFRAADWFKRQQEKINYRPSVDFQQVKADPLNLPQTGRFIVEQGVGSVPDMAAAAVNLPGYILSRTNNIAEERAKNEGRPGDVTLGDMAKAAPGATLEATLERFATKRLLPGGINGGTAAGRVGKQTALQSGTEFIEEIAGYGGETLGTQAGFKGAEALDRGMAGAIVGGPMGGGTQTGVEIVNRVRGPAAAPAEPGPAAPQTQPQAQAQTQGDIAGMVDLIRKTATQQRPLQSAQIQATGAPEPLDVQPAPVQQPQRRIEPFLGDAPATGDSAAAALADLIRQTATQDSSLQVAPTEPTQTIDEFLSAPAEMPVDESAAMPIEPNTAEVAALAEAAAPTPATVDAALPADEAQTIAVLADALTADAQAGDVPRMGNLASDATAARGTEPAAAEEIPESAPTVSASSLPQAATLQPAQAVASPQLQQPAKLDGTLAQQITEALPGMRPGDIVSARGAPFINKANAQKVAREAGSGWRVARSNKGFVVRWQPATDKQIANAKALAKRGAQVDVERDSMFAAIAKMGGLNRDQLIKEWGADPVDLKNLFGARHYTPLGFQREAETQKAAEYEEYLNRNDAQAAGDNGLPDEARDAIDEMLADGIDRFEDNYDQLERDALQWESEQQFAEQTDDDIPGFGEERVRSALDGQNERNQPLGQREGRSDAGTDQTAQDPRSAQGGVREVGAGSPGSAEGDGRRVEQRERSYDQKGQLDLFLDNGPDPSQAGPAGEAAQRAAVAAVDDLHATGTVLGRALSRDYAARQRISLVGRKVTGPEDLAVLAQVYRDPRFETFRVIFTNSQGSIVSQVGLTSRLPGSASAFVGTNLDEYLSDLADTAKNRGASRFYLLHNHPSGIATPSEADANLTRTFADRMPGLEFDSHVVIDTNEYATIGADGKWSVTQKDFGAVEPFTEGEWGGAKISGPETLMEIAKRIESDPNAVTLVVTDQQLRVKRLTTLPRDAIGTEQAANRRPVLRAAMRAQGAQIFAIGRDRAALAALDGIVVDAIHIGDQGEVTSLLAAGDVQKGSLYPVDRSARVSPETGPEFNYLRAKSMGRGALSSTKKRAPAGQSPLAESAGRSASSNTPIDNRQVREPEPSYDLPPKDRQEEIDLPKPGRKFEPIALRDFVSTERNAAGRREYAAGRKLYDRVAIYATDWLGKVKLADNKPDAFKAVLRQFRVDQMRAAENAKRIAEAGQALTPEQRNLLSDMIEKQAAVADVPPQEMVDLAASMTAALDTQARELVELGMLSEERLVKNYLPRLYKHGLAATLSNPTLLRGWFTKAMMRVRGTRLQSRGMYADLPVEQVEMAKRLGWKVSSLTDNSPLPDDLLEAFDASQPVPPNYQGAKVRMWRDYTEAERAEMGEVRDAVLRYAMGYAETQKDVAIGRLFKAIAQNPDLAKTFNPGGWVKIPTTEVQGAPGVKSYGALAGMYVEPQVADALKRNTQPKGALMAAYDKALNFWKEGKTVWNPVAHGNNVVSNLFTAYFAGVNPASPARWRETIREFRTRGGFWNEAVDNGLFGTEFANTEIQNLLMPDLDDMADLESVAASRVAKVIEFSKKYPGRPITWYREKMQRAYEFEDQFFKLMLYIDRRKAGMEPQAAINDTERYVFNYADVPEGVELVKRTYSPFFAYTYKAIPMVLHTAMTRPDRMIAPIALLGGANWLAYAVLGADEEKERKAMPEYLRGRTVIGTEKAVRMPFDIEGKPAFLDMSRRVPLGDLFDINNQTNGLPVPAPFMPSHPVISIMQAVVYNQDTFTGKDLVKKSDTAWEAAQARSGYLYRQFAPNAPFIPGSYNFNKLADATAHTFDTEMGPYTGRTRAGDPIPLSTTLPDVLTGTKIRSFDPQRNLGYQAAAIRKEESEVRANIRSAEDNNSMTDAARSVYIERQRRKLDDLSRQRQELQN